MQTIVKTDPRTFKDSKLSTGSSASRANGRAVKIEQMAAWFVRRFGCATIFDVVGGRKRSGQNWLLLYLSRGCATQQAPEQRPNLVPSELSRLASCLPTTITQRARRAAHTTCRCLLDHSMIAFRSLAGTSGCIWRS